jgi:hypothetical protein
VGPDPPLAVRSRGAEDIHGHRRSAGGPCSPRAAGFRSSSGSGARARPTTSRGATSAPSRAASFLWLVYGLYR